MPETIDFAKFVLITILKPKYHLFFKRLEQKPISIAVLIASFCAIQRYLNPKLCTRAVQKVGNGRLVVVSDSNSTVAFTIATLYDNYRSYRKG